MPTFKEIYKKKLRSLPTPYEQVINEFSVLTGKSNCTVYNWVAGRNLPDPTSAKMLSRYLGISITELFPGTKYDEDSSDAQAVKEIPDGQSDLLGKFQELLATPGNPLSSESRLLYMRLLWLFEKAGWPVALTVGDEPLAAPCGIRPEELPAFCRELQIAKLIEVKRTVEYKDHRPSITIYSLLLPK